MPQGLPLSELYPNDQKVCYLSVGEESVVYLSISTLIRHLIGYHRLHFLGTLGAPHTPFLTQTKLVDIVEFVLREGYIIEGEECKNGNFTVEYHFSYIIGCDLRGRWVRVVRVVVEPLTGRVITAYPFSTCTYSKKFCEGKIHASTTKICFKDHLKNGRGKKK